MLCYVAFIVSVVVCYERCVALYCEKRRVGVVFN